MSKQGKSKKERKLHELSGEVEKKEREMRLIKAEIAKRTDRPTDAEFIDAMKKIPPKIREKILAPMRKVVITIKEPYPHFFAGVPPELTDAIITEVAKGRKTKLSKDEREAMQAKLVERRFKNWESDYERWVKTYKERQESTKKSAIRWKSPNYDNFNNIVYAIAKDTPYDVPAVYINREAIINFIKSNEGWMRSVVEYWGTIDWEKVIRDKFSGWERRLKRRYPPRWRSYPKLMYPIGSGIRGQYIEKQIIFGEPPIK